ncbi:MAG: hypothetical protein ABIO71_08525 [Caldimonas sp.]
MSKTPPLQSDEPTGHYGTGYGEKQAPEGAAVPADPAIPAVPTGSAAPESITPRPPDQPPNADAPESEKAALIFERS